MARRVTDRDGIFPELHGALRLVEEIDRRLRLHGESEGAPLLDHCLVEEIVGLMEADRDVQRRLRPAYAGNVIEMRVGEQDVAHVQVVAPHRRQQVVDLIARVDQHGLPRLFTPDHESVLEERRHRSGFQDHLEFPLP
jgi:hypothetical protein